MARYRVLALLLFLGLVTRPAVADDKPLERISFGSCAKQDKPQPIWDAIVAGKPELFIFLV